MKLSEETTVTKYMNNKNKKYNKVLKPGMNDNNSYV